MMKPSLETVLSDPRIWRGADLAPVAVATSSGFDVLDRELPGGGWPAAGIIELQYEAFGQGEMRLLLPSLAAISRQAGKIVLIGPPYLPYAPAWAAAGVDLRQMLWLHIDAERERLWAFEQSLRSGACQVVLLWLAHRPEQRNWRRLQLAAEAGGCAGWVLLPDKSSAHSSPTPLRLQFGRDRSDRAPLVRIRKRRGVPLQRPISMAVLDQPFQRNRAACAIDSQPASPHPPNKE